MNDKEFLYSFENKFKEDYNQDGAIGNPVEYALNQKKSDEWITDRKLFTKEEDLKTDLNNDGFIGDPQLNNLADNPITTDESNGLIDSIVNFFVS